jgi:hypothetical protein
MPPQKQQIDISAGLVPAPSASTTPNSGVDISAGLVPANSQPPATNANPPQKGMLARAWEWATTPHPEYTAPDASATSRAVNSFGQNFGVPNRMADYVEGPADLISHPIDSTKLLLQSVGDAQQQTFNKAKEAYAKPGVMNKLDALGYGIESLIPVAGPAAASNGEKWASGDLAGAFGGTAGLTAGMLAPSHEQVRANVVDAASGAANKVNPRGMLAKRMAEVPPGEQFSRGEVYDAATKNGINLDLADATDAGPIEAAKKANSVSTFGKGVIKGNAKNNAVALDQWGSKLLNEIHPEAMTEEQLGNLAIQKLKAQQQEMYDSAGEAIQQADKTVGGARPDKTTIQKAAKAIVDEWEPTVNDFPEVVPKDVWRLMKSLAAPEGGTTPDGLTWKEFVDAKKPAALQAVGSEAKAMRLLQQQWQDLGGGDTVPLRKPLTWTKADKLSSYMMREAQTPNIVGTPGEGMMKTMSGTIRKAMADSAGKLSPLDQASFEKGTRIWGLMKDTFDNPQHPFYSIVRAKDGTTAANTLASLKPEYVRQLQQAMGPDFPAYQRLVARRFLDPKNTGMFDFKNLDTRMSRANQERTAVALTQEQSRELGLMGKVASKVTSDVNPSGTAKAGGPLIEGGLLFTHPPAGAALIGGNYASAKAITSPRVVRYLTQPKRGSIGQAFSKK